MFLRAGGQRGMRNLQFDPFPCLFWLANRKSARLTCSVQYAIRPATAKPAISTAGRVAAEAQSGREQLAVQSFADAMEIIPRTLAENAGIDPIDALTELKAAHDKGETWAGINVFTGKKMDAWKEGVIEPLKIKTQAVSSAAEVAVMILRIDDVINAEKKDGAPSPHARPPELD